MAPCALTVLSGPCTCAIVVDDVPADSTGAGADVAALSSSPPGIAAWVGKEGAEVLAPTSCLPSSPRSLLAPHSRLCPPLHPVIWHALEQYRGAVSLGQRARYGFPKFLADFGSFNGAPP